MSTSRAFTVPVPLLCGVLLVLAGCGDGGTAPDPGPAEVVKIQGDNQLGVPGETLPAELVVEVHGADGAPMADQSVAFTPGQGGAAQPSSAVTDANGRVSVLWTLGAAEGQQILAARAGDAETEFSATATSCEDPQPLEMGVGEVVSMAASGSGGCGFLLPSGASGDRYRIGVIRTGRSQTPSPSDVADIQVQVIGRGVVAAPERLEAVGAPPVRTGPAVALERPVRERLEAIRAATRATHEAMRRAERELVERMPRGSVLREPPAALKAPMAVDLPDKLQIDPSTPAGCSPAGETVTALKIAEDDRLAIYQDSAQNASSQTEVTEVQARAVLDFYRDHGRPVIDAYFDGVDDIDGNGKVIVFISPEVQGNTAAFVWSGDFYTKDRCPASNAGEYIFFNHQLFHDITSAGPSLAMEVIAHEVKHVSSLYRRVLRSDDMGSNQLHPSWIEEGSAEIAGEVASRHAWAAVGGPAIHEAVVEDHWRADPSGAVTSEIAGVLWVLLQTQGFGSSQPNSIMLDPSGAGSDHSFYGSSWHLHRFLGDAYGEAGDAPMADAAFFRALNDQDTPPGIDGIEEITGRSWETLLEEYVAASMVNGQDVTPPSRAFTSYDFVSAIELFCIAVDPVHWDDSSCAEQNASGPGPPGAFPWPVTTDTEGEILSRGFETASYSGPAGPAGVRVHDFTSNGSGEGAEIRVIAPSPSRVVVVRLR